ncbi:hypothetical protein HDV05_000885 [Chytridiales sp. JEL 0842]|nr:hypothetical protein HDV05_000885 [Chytridiales sp. JEL 0842]
MKPRSIAPMQARACITRNIAPIRQISAFRFVATSKSPTTTTHQYTPQMFRGFSPEKCVKIALSDAGDDIDAQAGAVVQAVIAPILDDVNEKLLEKDELIHEKDERIMDKENIIRRYQADHDYLAGTLDGRHLIERFEATVKSRGTRKEKWLQLLKIKPELAQRLNSVCETALIPSVVDNLYHVLSVRVHEPRRLWTGDFQVFIPKGISSRDTRVLEILAEDYYGPNVHFVRDRRTDVDDGEPV